MRDEIKSLQQVIGITTLYVTHDQGEALAISDKIAVMSAGRVLQVGSPREIYEEPANQFVASFIGQANFIDVKVAQEGEGLVRVTIGDDMVLSGVATAKDTPRSGNAVMTIRPERVVISRTRATGESTFPAKIESVVYTGASLQYRVDMTGTRILVEDKNKGDIFNVGEPIFVTLKPRDCHLLGE